PRDVQKKRPFADRLNFPANYPYGRSMTDSPSFRSAAMESEVPQDNYDLGNEWGPGGCDIRHRFVMSLIYQVPFSSSAAAGAGLLTRLGRWIGGGWQGGAVHPAHGGLSL